MEALCARGPALLVAAARLLLPLAFLTEGVAKRPLLLDLTAAERVVAGAALYAAREALLARPRVLLLLSVSALVAVPLGDAPLLAWAIALASILVVGSAARAAAPSQPQQPPPPPSELQQPRQQPQQPLGADAAWQQQQQQQQAARASQPVAAAAAAASPPRARRRPA
jgi:hypothetical protein